MTGRCRTAEVASVGKGDQVEVFARNHRECSGRWDDGSMSADDGKGSFSRVFSCFRQVRPAGPEKGLSVIRR